MAWNGAMDLWHNKKHLPVHGTGKHVCLCVCVGVGGGGVCACVCMVRVVCL